MRRNFAYLLLLTLAQAPCDHVFLAGDTIVTVWTGPNDDGLLPDLQVGEVFTVAGVRESTGGVRLIGRSARSGWFRADRFCRNVPVS